MISDFVKNDSPSTPASHFLDLYMFGMGDIHDRPFVIDTQLNE